MRQRGLDLGRTASFIKKRRRRVAGLCVALLLLAGGWKHGGWLLARAMLLPGRASAALSSCILPRYTKQLERLQAENAILRTELAACSGMRAENQALRAWLGNARSPRPDAAPCVLEQLTSEGLVVAAPGLRPGQAVLDPYGRLSGLLQSVDAQNGRVARLGSGGFQPVCAAGAQGVQGVVVADRFGRLHLTGLPRHSAVQKGDVVKTLGGSRCPAGLWVGRLAENPAPDQAGLCTSAKLCETAVWAAQVYFAVETVNKG